jgi:hypothetical protein
MVVAALLAAALASPTPAPSASPAALHEIGRVRTSATCPALIVHANGAISSVLRNDLALAQTIARLRAIDLETSPLSRRNGVTELGRLALDLRDRAARGDDEVRRLREMAKRSSDETQRAELKSFADALGGALYRQKKIALDINGMLAYLDYREMRSSPEMERVNRVAGPVFLPGTNPALLRAASGEPPPETHGSPNQMAQAAAADFETRLPLISADESKAAEHTEGAVSSC